MKKNYTTKFLARKLRKQGLSYGEILKKVKASKSSLSLWLRDIPLNDKQRIQLTGRQISRYQASKNRQENRKKLTEIIINKAIKESKKYLNDKLFICGIMLYWAEGTKRSQEAIIFSNSDPEMIKLMMKWFRKKCKVPEEKFRIQIQAHSLHIKQNLIEHWSNVTNIPAGQFHKLIIKKSSLGHRKNILYNGTCSIRICNKNLFRKIMGWKIGVLKHFGIKDTYQIPE